MKSRTKGNNNTRKNGYRQYAIRIIAHRKFLQEQYKVKEIGIFGSVVRGQQKKRSDVDILVDFQEVPDLLEFIGLELYLQKLLKKKVDLVDKQGIVRQIQQGSEAIDPTGAKQMCSLLLDEKK